MISAANGFTLAEVTDEYLIQRFIDRKKYFDIYLTIAKRAWQKIFWDTLYVVQNVWLPLKEGTPYNYIDVPHGTARIFSVNNVDLQNKIQPLYYNNQLNILPKPTVNTCGCTACQCDGLCDDLNSVQLQTKLLFTINNINYYEKIWIKYCKNGDVIKWREVPVKKYNDFIGDLGDYNNDYNPDYLVGSQAFQNFTIVTQTFQEKLCTLEVRPCGCPVNNDANISLINTFCGCFFPAGFFTRHNEKPKTFLDDINSNCFGEVKLSECGTKLYFRPTRKFNHTIPANIEPIIPDFLLLSYQSNGLDCTEQTVVPEFSLDAMWTTMDYRSKRFNAKYSKSEKDDAKAQMNDAINQVIGYLNPLNMQELANVQDGPIYW